MIPGTLITLQASAYVDNYKISDTVSYCVVARPFLFNKPVYSSKFDKILPGMRVRKVCWVGQSYITVDGVVTTEGKILTDNGMLVEFSSLR